MKWVARVFEVFLFVVLVICALGLLEQLTATRRVWLELETQAALLRDSHARVANDVVMLRNTELFIGPDRKVPWKEQRQ